MAAAVTSIMAAGGVVAPFASPFIPSAAAGTPAKTLEKPIMEEAFGSRINGLVVNEFSDHYITPRGLNVEDEGLIWQPLVLIFWNLYKSDAGFLEDISLTTGVWNSIHTEKSGAKPGHWNELDPILGLTFKFAKGWQFDAFTTQFYSETDSYATSTHLDLKLTYHDSCFGQFSLNPFVQFWQELEEKSTVVFDPSTSSEGNYFCVGINPTYKFKSIPLTVEMPTFLNLVSDNFYQKFDGSDGGSGFALISTTLKLSTPLSFIPKGYGAWTVYASVQYYHLENDGLLDGNQVLADASREQDLLQFHGGISIFF